MSTYAVSVQLRCSHMVQFQIAYCPMMGETMWCQSCRAWSVVIQAPARYRVQCRTCGKGRGTFGGALLSAQLYADKHRRSKPTHTTDVYNGLTVIETREPQQDLQEALDKMGDEPPY
jgi:hypothetical protein